MVKDNCQVVSCSKQKTDGLGITLHRVPSDQLDAERWLCFLNKANEKFVLWKPIKRMHVCSDHFKRDDIKCTVSGRRNLVKGRFPCMLDGVDLTEHIIKHVPSPFIDITHQEVVIEEAHVPPEIIELQNQNLEQEQTIKAQQIQIKEMEIIISQLKSEVNELKRKNIQILQQRCKRQAASIIEKNEKISELKVIVKRQKTEWSLPGPVTSADNLLSEIIERRFFPKNHSYSEKMKEFCFNVHYISPKGYSYFRNQLGGFLPDPSNCSKWTRHVDVKPGLLHVSLEDIRKTCASKNTYYNLAFDEMAIRQQVIFDGVQMVGNVDYGGISEVANVNRIAKSALFCLATELNGRKSFPLAYILTDGLKSNVMADFVASYIRAAKDVGGQIIGISCDGLRANFTALQCLGANFKVDLPEFCPHITISNETNSGQDSELDSAVDEETSIHHIFPDVSHMMKLARNVLDKYKVIYNGECREISWSYVSSLQQLQEQEQLRAANKLTTRHVHFHQKKMNTKLSVQVLSRSVACSLDFCRKIGVVEFEGSEATAEFFRINDEVFDLLNSRPFGSGSHEPLSFHNEVRWTSIISTAKKYYLDLKVLVGEDLVPLYKTANGTFIKGLLCCLTSLEMLMNRINSGEINLMFVPTYRLSQDPLELFFGGVRRRLGNNDNPNVKQLAYAVRAMLCYKLHVCQNGNAEPQELLQDKVSNVQFHGPRSSLSETTGNEDEEEEKIEEIANTVHCISSTSFEALSLFVENVVVHIAGFVGAKLTDQLNCIECKMALSCGDIESVQFREDFILLLEKDRGGLFKPSDDLLILCKLIERVIRVEQTAGLFSLDSKKIELKVKRECIGRSIFNNLHYSFGNSDRATFVANGSHKWNLISDICKLYIKTRLHYVAKTSSFRANPVSNRSKCTKLVHFAGN